MVQPNTRRVNLLNDLNIETRPNAGPGLWLMVLLPLSIIITTFAHPVITTTSYKLTALLSNGLIATCLILLHHRNIDKHRKRALYSWLTAASFVTAILFEVCLHKGIIFSLWSGTVSTILYYKLYEFILRKLPNCFTLGEAAIFTQSLIIFFYSATLNISNSLWNTPTSVMHLSTLIIQVGLLGILLIVFLAYNFDLKSPKKFYTTALLTIIFTIFLPLHILLEVNPLLWIINLIKEDFYTNKVVLFWIGCSILAILAVNRQINKAKKASTSIRKIFHLLSVAVFVPGLLFNCSFLYLASGVVLGCFLGFELVMILDVPPLARTLQNGLAVFCDEKDAGVIALTPIYLLVGCSLPLWIHPAPCDLTNSATFNLLPLLSGILTVGIGDTAASIIGSNFGKYYWTDSKKTIEGTVAFILSQIVAIAIFIHFDFLKFFSVMQYVQISLAILATAIIEAKTDQIDNLVLPLIMYLILILPVT